MVEESFHLFSVLCCNRNFIAKSYIHQYLNLHNRDGVEVIINYLNIPLSGTLSNYLFSLITNLYVDSCPRINRHKPLFVINFVFKKGEEELSGKENSRVSNEEAELSTRLRENLLSRI